MMIVLRATVFLGGLALVIATIHSAMATFVLPRGAPSALTRAVFFSIRRLFDLPLKRVRDYRRRDSILAFYAPTSLLALLPAWLALVCLGYALMFWGTGVDSWYLAFRDSGSSLLTLGFEPLQGAFQTFLGFTEATIGLILIALLIAYLPSIYAAFSRREAAVTLLEVRAGSPPSALQMLLRYNRIHGLEQLSEQWRAWEEWFADIQESHTSLAALVFFRSPQPDHSWITAAGAVLDAAALTRSTVDIPHDAQADLCLRAGFLALRHIASFFGIGYNPDPHFPPDAISVSRAEYDAACEQLAEAGVPLKPDREQAWRDFGGWRVNYDSVLLGLCALTMAPDAPWSADRLPRATQARWWPAGQG